MKICLVRHGQTDWNKQLVIQGHSDIPLNEIGRKQANDSGLFLKNDTWDLIISSPLSRAKETAEIIASHIQYNPKDIILDQQFIERDFGSLNGKDIKNHFQHVIDNSLDDLEKELEIQERVQKALDSLVLKYPNKNIIVTAHSHTIKAALVSIDPEQFNFRTILHNACANYISYKDGKWMIEQHNISDHIGEY